MKKLVIAGILNVLLLSSTLPASAQETSSTATSSVDLSFDPAQIQLMLNKMGETSLTEADQAFIDSIIKNPLDKNAIEAAQAVIERRLQWSMYELSELKKLALRYMIVSSQVTDKQYLKLIAKEHTNSAQNHYNRAMWSLAAANNDLSGVLAECVTEVCAIQVTSAFQELRQFVEKVNKDIDFENAKSSVDLFWKFENPILKTSLGKTFRKMIPNNEDHNAWKAAGAALLAPLSFAGQVVYSYGKAAGTAILNPRYMNIKFSVDEVRIDYDVIDDDLERQITKELPNIFQGRETPSQKNARYAKEAEERRVITELMEKAKREREAKEAEEKRIRDAKAAEEKAIRDAKAAEENKVRNVPIISYIRQTVGDPNYLPSAGMIEVAGRYFGYEASRSVAVGACSVDLYNGSIRGAMVYDWRYDSTYNNDLKVATTDLVKRLYYGKCDR